MNTPSLIFAKFVAIFMLLFGFSTYFAAKYWYALIKDMAEKKYRMLPLSTIIVAVAILGLLIHGPFLDMGVDLSVIHYSIFLIPAFSIWFTLTHFYWMVRPQKWPTKHTPKTEIIGIRKAKLEGMIFIFFGVVLTYVVFFDTPQVYLK